MAGPPRYPNTGDDSGLDGDRSPASGTPRWVSVLGIVIAIGLVLLFVVLHLTGALGRGGH
jgi:hypothetical protein